MSDVIPFAGPVAVLVICLLVFIEEAGVPMPMFPGDAMLLAAGIMIGAGQISPWMFYPLAYVAAVSGAMVGYTWTRRLGREGLFRLADRLRLRRHLERASDRLSRTGTAGVILGRVLPGTRCYTNLVAGASGMSRAAFARGLTVSAAIWLGTLTGLGIAVGVQAKHYVHQFQAALETLGVLVGMLVLLALCLRWLRPPAHPESRRIGRRPRLRLLAAAAVDLGLLAFAVFAIHELGPHQLTLKASFPPPDTMGAVEAGLVIEVTVGAVMLIYALAARLAFGTTVGERMARASYRDVVRAATGGGDPTAPATAERGPSPTPDL